MTHGHINKLEKLGYLKRDYQSKKIVHYNITPDGMMRKQYLQIRYVGARINIGEVKHRVS